MKRLLILPIVLVLMGAMGSPIPQKYPRATYYTSDYGNSLSATHTRAALASNSEVVVDSAVTLSSSGTITTSVPVRVTGAGSITKTASDKIYFGDAFDSDVRQVFIGFGAGDVTFGSGIVDVLRPEWWGAAGNYVKATGVGTDDTTAIDSAMNSGGYSITLSPRKTYKYNGLGIKGSRYKGFINTREIDASRTSYWDSVNREYLDSTGQIWRLELNSPPMTALPYKGFDWDMSQFTKAITGGAATITFVGTSITEGTVAQAENESTWVNQFKQKLISAFPNVTFTFKNLGLASRLVSNYTDTGFLGLASEPANKSTGFYRAAGTDIWPDGSTVGKSWQDHAEDTAPDLLIVHFGMNDGGVADHTFSASLLAAITDARSWSKIPSIVLVSEMGAHAAVSTQEESIRANSRTTRYVAKKQRIGLIDVSRQWQYLRTGTDETDYITQRQTSVAAWPVYTNAGTPTTFDTHTATTIANSTSTMKIGIKHGNYCGMRASFTFTPSDNAGIAGVVVHIKQSSNVYTDTAVVLLRSGTGLAVYDYSGHAITTMAGLSTVTSGVAETLDIRVIYNAIEFYKGGVLIGKYNLETVGYIGGVGLALRQGTLSNIVVDVAAPKIISAPIFDDDDLLGRVSAAAGWNISDFEDGGNNNNHPSRIGLSYGFAPEVDRFLKEATDRASAPRVLKSLATTNGPAGACTLAAGAATTTVNNTSVTANSLIYLMPTSANSAADQGSATGVWVSAKSAGVSFTITHPNNANADKTFNYLILN